jgi:hypothetical protein
MPYIAMTDCLPSSRMLSPPYNTLSFGWVVLIPLLLFKIFKTSTNTFVSSKFTVSVGDGSITSFEYIIIKMFPFTVSGIRQEC